MQSERQVGKVSDEMLETETAPSVADNPGGAVKFECGICLKEFSTSWCLHLHIKTHTEEVCPSCEECGMIFPGFQELYEHLNLHISGSEPAEDPETSAHAKNSLTQTDMHKLKHTFKPALTCAKCGKCFGSDQILKLHLRYHDKKKPYKCQICGLRFALRNAFMLHWKSARNGAHKSDPNINGTQELGLKRVRPTRARPVVPHFELAKDRHVDWIGKDKHRCRVCKAELPQSMKMRRAHVRKHLLVKLNKSFYHVWKYLKAPMKRGRDSRYTCSDPASKTQTHANSLFFSEGQTVTPPSSDDEHDGAESKSISADGAEPLVKDQNILQDTCSDKQSQEELKAKRHPGMYRCEVCGTRLRRKKDLTEHFQISHAGRKTTKLKSDSQLVVKKRKSVWFTCATCGDKLRGRKNFDAHIQLAHKGKQWSENRSRKMKRCGDLVQDQEYRLQNPGEHNSDETLNVDLLNTKYCQLGPWFKCSICGKLEKGKKNLQDHIQQWHSIFERPNTEAEAQTSTDGPPGAQNRDSETSDSHREGLKSLWRKCCWKLQCAWFLCNVCNNKFKGKRRVKDHVLVCQQDISKDASRSETNDSNAQINPPGNSLTLYPWRPVTDKPRCSWYICGLCHKRVQGKKRVHEHSLTCQGEKMLSHNGRSSNKTSIINCRVENPSMSNLDVSVNEGTSSDPNVEVSSMEPGIVKHKVGPWHKCLLCNKMLKGKAQVKAHKHNQQGSMVEEPKHGCLQETRHQYMTAAGVIFLRSGTWYKCPKCMKYKKGKLAAENHVCDNTAAEIERNAARGTISANFVKSGSWYKCRLCGRSLRGMKIAQNHVNCRSGSAEPGGQTDASGQTSENMSVDGGHQNIRNEDDRGSDRTETEEQALDNGQTSDSATQYDDRPTTFSKDKNHEVTVSECEKNPQFMSKNSSESNFVKNGNWYRCLICMKALRSRKYLKAHCHYHDSTSTSQGAPILNHETEERDLQNKPHNSIGTVQEADETTARLGQYWKCKVCGKQFMSKSSMSTHMKNHLHSRRFECSQCSNHFVTMSGLKLHQRSNDHCGSLPVVVSSASSFLKDSVRHPDLEQDNETVDCNSSSPGFNRMRALGTRSDSKANASPVLTRMRATEINSVSKTSRSPVFTRIRAPETKSGSKADSTLRGRSSAVEFGDRPLESSEDLPALDFYGEAGVKKCGESEVNGPENSDLGISVEDIFNSSADSAVTKHGIDQNNANQISTDRIFTSPDSDTISSNFMISDSWSRRSDQNPVDRQPAGSVDTDLSRSVGDCYVQQDGVFLCKICSKRCRTKCSVIIHVKSHLSGRELRCQTCGFMASNSSNLKKHVMNKHTFSPATTRTITQKVQSYMNTEESSYTCGICSKSFAGKTQVKRHIRRHIMRQLVCEKTASNSQVTEESFKTHQRSETRTCTDGRNLLTTELVAQTSLQVNQGSSCPTNSYGDQAVGGNVGTAESDNTKQQRRSACQQWVCLQIDQQIGDQHCLIKGQFACQICFKTFATQLTASEHVRSHFSQESSTCWRACTQSENCLQVLSLQPECKACGVVFDSNGALLEHEETHTERERLELLNYLKCVICGKLCRSHDLLQKHQSFHSCTLKCSQCYSFFTDIIHLDLHILMKRHFMCGCGQVFLDNMKLHMHKRHCCFEMH